MFVMIMTIHNNHGSYIICYISVCFFLYKYIDQYKKNQTILVEENFTWNSQWSLVACGEPRFIFKGGILDMWKSFNDYIVQNDIR